ncbi:hypothetical protein PHYSODRAFT_341980 [Phytophthora sojae]|uniref:Uncharacterized protein n=1 Tax=Phytophthora sojae (strain P6497) TaxID=1094619 RepID=G5AEZ2_PHYSP|nr:hypothetical protein PHYSODRAFT_341980 [Phytophthora sojae]EGZ05782.1 hypothetical protein PHYSODRAFT_341980 [Phytophthora sojae]|eukprot:XP_009538643.1 hypothetical protein PHYSODRAFT_341980 [Phytophthora sojae]
MPSLGKARAPASARVEVDWSDYSSEDEDLGHVLAVEDDDKRVIEAELIEEEARRLNLQEWIGSCSSYKASGQYFEQLELESLRARNAAMLAPPHPPPPGKVAPSLPPPAPGSPTRPDPEVQALQASLDKLQQTVSELLQMRMRGGCTSYRQLALVEKLRSQMVQQQNEELRPKLRKARDTLGHYYHFLGRVRRLRIVRQELSRLLGETPHNEIPATDINES